MLTLPEVEFCATPGIKLSTEATLDENELKSEFVDGPEGPWLLLEPRYELDEQPGSVIMLFVWYLVVENGIWNSHF